MAGTRKLAAILACVGYCQHDGRGQERNQRGRCASIARRRRLSCANAADVFVKTMGDGVLLEFPSVVLGGRMRDRDAETDVRAQRRHA